MFDSKFLCTLTALVVTVIAICNVVPAEGNITENFLNSSVSTGTKTMSVNRNNVSDIRRSDVMSHPTFTPISTTDRQNYQKLGAHARTEKALASDGSVMNSGFITGNSALYELIDEPADSTPIGTITTLNADGLDSEHIIYERNISSISKSRTRGQGDMIRGDLLIAPCNSGWFQVAANPAADLQQGAMHVLGGLGSENEKLAQKLFTDHGGNFITSDSV